jgi:hypothetical protein
MQRRFTHAVVVLAVMTLLAASVGVGSASAGGGSGDARAIVRHAIERVLTTSGVHFEGGYAEGVTARPPDRS